MNDIHCTYKSKVYTESSIPYQIKNLINHANARNKPIRFNDFIVDKRHGHLTRLDKISRRQNSIFKNIIDKMSMGYNGFIKCCKTILLNSYDEICTKPLCYTCGRQ